MSEENEADQQPNKDDESKAFAARLKEAMRPLEDQLNETNVLLQQEREARIKLEEAQNKPSEKVYTREELLQAVEDEAMTQRQADDLWEKQITENATKKALNAINQRESGIQVDRALREYTRLKPDIARQGTEDREKVEEEYRYLLSTGLPSGVATELAAVRNVFGPVEKIKKQLDIETHQETGGGNAPPAEKDSGPKGLSTRQKDYYQKRIDMGIYKGWDDVEAELKFKKQSNG